MVLKVVGSMGSEVMLGALEIEPLSAASQGGLDPRTGIPGVAPVGAAGAPLLLEQLGHGCDGLPTEVILPDDSLLASLQDADDFDASILADFIGESRDYLRDAEAALLQLETDPTAAEPINVVFRAFHTIKGTAAFLDLQEVTEIAHHAESLLQRFREGELRCTGPRADLALRSVDMLQALLNGIEAESLLGEQPARPAGYDDLLCDLEEPPIELLTEQEEKPQKIRLGDILVQDGLITRERLEEVFATKGEESIGLALVRTGAVSLQDVAKALRKQQGNAAPEQAHEMVRLPKEQLERLFELADSLQLLSSSGALDAQGSNPSRGAAQLVEQLHSITLSLRSVPIGEVFQKMTRVARDAGRRAGKEVELIISGEEIEIPRSVAGHLADPLVHMIRNAIDHGIEDGGTREVDGKSRGGQVRLTAARDGDGVVVTLADDGAGLNREKIIAKGLAEGLIVTPDGHEDSDVYNLVFEPGFSTVDVVTELSGRGVGMDVVRRNIEAAGGTIRIDSVPGAGTTFTMRFGLRGLR